MHRRSSLVVALLLLGIGVLHARTASSQSARAEKAVLEVQPTALSQGAWRVASADPLGGRVVHTQVLFPAGGFRPAPAATVLPVVAPTVSREAAFNESGTKAETKGDDDGATDRLGVLLLGMAGIATVIGMRTSRRRR